MAKTVNSLYKIYSPREKSYPLVHDVVLKKLIVNTDPRGTLVEMLKTTWTDVYDEKKLPFTQVYYSLTIPGVARDQDRWHFHPGGQVDRYVVIFGNVVFAVYDIREQSPTKDRLNLFWVGDSLGPDGQYEILVPPRTLHGFLVVGDKPATLLNFPSKLYDPEEEWRLPFAQYPLPDGSIFSWETVAKAFHRYAQKI